MKPHSTKASLQLQHSFDIMQKKKLPILHKVSIFITKMRMPVIHFVKSRRVKKFKLLRHYNYGFLGEYEFTPSSTPLIYCPPNGKFKKRSFRELSSMLFLCRCLGHFAAENSDGDFVLPAPDVEDFSALEMDEDSVDQRAERFIEWFYEEMRMQGRQSL